MNAILLHGNYEGLGIILLIFAFIVILLTVLAVFLIIKLIKYLIKVFRNK